MFSNLECLKFKVKKGRETIKFFKLSYMTRRSKDRTHGIVFPD